MVSYKFGEKSSQSLRSNGFQDVTFKSYNAYVILRLCRKVVYKFIKTTKYNNDLFEYMQAWSLYNPGRDGRGLCLAKVKTGA